MIITLAENSVQLKGSMVPRSPGLHVSTIIKSMCKDLKMPPFDKEREMPEGKLEQYGEIGFIWEDMVSLVWSNRAHTRPPEISRDGIIMSPDGIDVCEETGEVILEEYKATWSSNRNEPNSVWRWMMQTKAYCGAMGSTFVRFYVLYVNGDYKPPMPDMKVYEIRFSQGEIDSAWNSILQHAQSKGMFDEHSRFHES